MFRVHLDPAPCVGRQRKGKLHCHAKCHSLTLFAQDKSFPTACRSVQGKPGGKHPRSLVFRQCPPTRGPPCFGVLRVPDVQKRRSTGRRRCSIKNDGSAYIVLICLCWIQLHLDLSLMHGVTQTAGWTRGVRATALDTPRDRTAETLPRDRRVGGHPLYCTFGGTCCLITALSHLLPDF
jgi:hypothetical protein